MRTDVVVVAAPDLDNDLRLRPASEPFERQALVTELAVEALVFAVLPRFVRIDLCALDARVGEPGTEGIADELRAVVRAQQPRRAVYRDRAGEDLDHVGRTNRARNVDRQALPGKLIDDAQVLALQAARAGVDHYVVSPDVVGAECRQGPRT